MFLLGIHLFPRQAVYFGFDIQENRKHKDFDGQDAVYFFGLLVKVIKAFMRGSGEKVF